MTLLDPPHSARPSGEERVPTPVQMSGSQPDADSEAGQQHDPEQPLESIPLDIESTWSAWLCVLGSFMFLVPSFGESVLCRFHRPPFRSDAVI
ncbi:hypothetical protein AUP68_17736 [Ilyonectria robusta]